MTEGLRERKKAETHQALAAAALRLADQLGPERVTVEAIAEAAGVSPRTFFNYFSSKEDAIVGIAPGQPSALLTDLLGRPEGEEPLESLRAVVLTATERIRAGADDWVIRHRLTQRHPSLAVLRAAWFADVEEQMAQEIGRRVGLDAHRDPYPALVVSAALAAMRIAITVWHERDRAGTLEELLDEAFDAFAFGLHAPRPRAAAQ